MAKRSYSISELAREFDITTRTIRFYEEKGLLNPQREGQQRRYSESDRVRLTLILRGKRIGLSLQESQKFIAMYDPAHGNIDQLQSLLTEVNQRQQQLQQQMQDLKAMLTELDDVQSRCQQALQHAQQQEPMS
jgi:DNA-binding transcriptional MerR regulator